MHPSHLSGRSVVVAAVLAVSAAAGSVFADPSTDDKSKQPAPIQQSQHRPPIDLQDQAKQRRPGQVLPGDPSPASAAAVPAPAPVAAPIATKPTPAEPPVPVIPLADSTLPATAVPQPKPAKPVEAAPMDVGVVASVPMPASVSAASVRVASVGSGAAEWRGQVGGWQPLAPDQTTESRVEIRAGLDSDVVVEIDHLVQVKVERLGRVSIERATEADGTTTVSLVLGRGLIEVRPLAGADTHSASRWLARVRTPDRSLALTLPARLTYDAFSGTRVRVIADTGR